MSRASRLRVHPFDPLSARCGSHERIGKVLCSLSNLVAPEFHDAHGAGRLAVLGQEEFRAPEITTASDSPDRKPLFVRLTRAFARYVVSTAGSSRLMPNADSLPRGSLDLALQKTARSFVDRSS
jgi:hypothetical protein